MINLLKEKLDQVIKLKSLTQETLDLSSKAEALDIYNMIEGRQKYMDNIDLIEQKIKDLESTKKAFNKEDENKIANINKEIKEHIKQIVEIDKEIRKNLNLKLKNIKIKLNQPEVLTNPKINLKI